MRSSSRARARFVVLLVTVSFVAPGAAARGADASSSTPPPELSTTVDTSGTGGLVTTARTAALRARVPEASAPRILLIGTGVQRSLFPSALQAAIGGATSADTTDIHGYGTLAASVIFQLIPDATIVSRAVRPRDANWFLLDLDSLTSALQWARAHRGSFDAVLLAFPPQAALDPITYSIGYGDYGRFGRGMTMVTEALLNAPKPVKGQLVGIPTDKQLRDRVFARANLKQRAAVETFAVHAKQWRRTVTAAESLIDSGAPVIAPAGDFTRRSGSQLVPLPTQTVYGLSALPSVLTVGAAYARDGVERVSPTSGRGPTLTLGMKPDVLAPSDVMAMLPAGARLGWGDDSARAPLQLLDWARSGVPPSPCPNLQNAYRCVLQGSSLVSASVVAANLAAAVASGAPRDPEVLRGFALAQASGTRARSSSGDRNAFVWEQGAGVFSGLRGFDAKAVPVPLRTAEFGEVRWGKGASTTVPVWSGGAPVASARAAIDSFVGPDPSGRSVAASWSEAGRVDASPSADGAVVTATGAQAQGGVYGGIVTLTSGGGRSVTVPLALTQTVPVDAHVNYAYNAITGNGSEGERVEDAAVVLFAGMPTNVGVVGEAFKNFGSSAWARFGGDPTNSVVIRAAVTQSAFRSPGLPAREHGRARLRDVPPGFYRFHVMTDHGVDVEQTRGRAESIGIQLATSGPEGLNDAGMNLLVSSCAGAVAGPLPCARPGGDVDPSSGLCVARNTSTDVAFNVYCREISYAVPSAMVSRAIHLIEFDADRARNEWKTCGVNVPTDGSPLDLGQIQQRAVACGGATAPTAWNFSAGARDCLGPTERRAFPTGVPTDVTATYHGAGPASLAGRNLPVGVLTYEFKLPTLNTYTTAGVAMSYVTENAIVAVRFRASADPNADASSSLIGYHGPSVNAAPAISGAAARGSRYQEWAVMSANATVGQLSIIVIPTAWARADLDPTKPIAKVQLCDVALRAITFAKDAWGPKHADGSHFFPMLDRGLASQVDPSKERIRPIWDGERFTDAGMESESLRFAVQIPKNTTLDPSAPHHVRSPLGGPGALRDARRWGTDARRHETILESGYRTYDPGYGVISLACNENAVDPVLASTCKAWKAARASNATVAELGPDLLVNGRFAGVLALDEAAIARAAGNLAYEIDTVDDGGAFERRWATAGGRYLPRVPVPNFYDDLADAAPLSLLDGMLRFGKDAGLPVLTMQTSSADGTPHTITARI